MQIIKHWKLTLEPVQTQPAILPLLLANFICWNEGPKMIPPPMTICYSGTMSLCDSDVLPFLRVMETRKSEPQIANKEMQMNLLKCISSLFCFWLPIGTFSCLSALKFENKTPLETKQSELKCVCYTEYWEWCLCRTQLQLSLIFHLQRGQPDKKTQDNTFSSIFVLLSV